MVRRLFTQEGMRLATCRIAYVEGAAAMARRCSEGLLTVWVRRPRELASTGSIPRIPRAARLPSMTENRLDRHRDNVVATGLTSI